ncbi:GlxA family transcriptional regulator [Paraglaciecola hydrolytica]|uniref:AraC family transcriptional regulator n=1 Tax=Paraglaciecola hydrolytica TaxID=1799789 RepID=A0A136A6C8_9ALTE|nr:helix-turn-helix domain-containing protein [Paraglaciecola hydrolytica]KXI30786.1 AraC family transcriptional regulator [Paraglaciecola hydrolytica]
MFNVTILGFNQAYASAITGALDLFALAGVTWQRMQGISPTPYFNVQIATIKKQPLRCINQLEIRSHIAIEDVKQTDLLLIPTIGGSLLNVLADNQALLPHIKRHFDLGADIASNCSGAFFLAEAGLLNGKEATTHWGYAELFRKRYPEVKLCAEKLITSQQNIYCAGGGMAWFDLALLLIERYCGHDVASTTAKAHVIDLSRGQQAAYASIRAKKYHQDPEVLLVQEWLEANYVKPIQISQLPNLVNLTSRTLNRRFKQATEQNPLEYLQNLRIEAAKKLLEKSHDNAQRIVNHVGYDDLSSFTRLFKKHTGLSPSQYAKKFKR